MSEEHTHIHNNIMISFTDCLDQTYKCMYTHTYAHMHVQLSYLGALVMNHHQVVDDVQSKLPRSVQLQDMGLLTGSLSEQTWQSVIHKHRHTHLYLI